MFYILLKNLNLPITCHVEPKKLVNNTFFREIQKDTFLKRTKSVSFFTS